MKMGKTNTPIVKLYSLEVTAVNETSDTPGTENNTLSIVQLVTEGVTQKLARNAAIKAHKCIKS